MTGAVLHLFLRNTLISWAVISSILPDVSSSILGRSIEEKSDVRSGNLPSSNPTLLDTTGQCLGFEAISQLVKSGILMEDSLSIKGMLGRGGELVVRYKQSGKPRI